MQAKRDDDGQEVNLTGEPSVNPGEGAADELRATPASWWATLLQCLSDLCALPPLEVEVCCRKAPN